MDAQETINLEAVDVGLLVFGGTDEVAGISGCEDAFAKAFSVERNERSWEMVGAAPFTMKCLESDEVRIDESDPNFSNHKSIEAANHNATSMLTAKGFNGELMKVVSNRTAHENEPVTAPFTNESVAGIASTKTPGQFFKLHNRMHHTHDDVLKAEELKERSVKVEKLQKEKKN